MINTGYATFYKRPEVFNVIGMNLAANINFCTWLDSLMLITESGYVVIARKLISVKNRIRSYMLGDIGQKCRPLEAPIPDPFGTVSRAVLKNICSSKVASFIIVKG
jgi:hypothetical protein